MQMDRILRQCRSALDQGALPLRAKVDLDLFEEAEIPGERVLPDTCVFIDQLQGRLPETVEARVLARTIVHSPIILGELSFLIGNLNQAHPNTGTSWVRSRPSSVPFRITGSCRSSPRTSSAGTSLPAAWPVSSAIPKSPGGRQRTMPSLPRRRPGWAVSSSPGMSRTSIDFHNWTRGCASPSTACEDRSDTWAHNALPK